MVRDQLAANTRDHRHRAKAAEPSLLAGLLVDVRGERLTELDLPLDWTEQHKLLAS